MPVHSAGPRLYHGIKFKYLVRNSASGVHGKARGSNISMNLVPFVDMMTILVCFLLQVFSASNALLQAQPGLDLPIAQSTQTLQAAPVIVVSKSEITVYIDGKGNQVTTVDTVLRDKSPTYKIDALYDKLKGAAEKIADNVKKGRLEKVEIKACDDARNNLRPQPGKYCPEGLAILQADETIDVRIINKIVNTAKAAGFDNLLFAVKNKS